MTSQAKNLKRLLKERGITDYAGNVHVRTERNKHGEWGCAVAHVRALTDEQVASLKQADPYIEISNYPNAKFAMIRG